MFQRIFDKLVSPYHGARGRRDKRPQPQGSHLLISLSELSLNNIILLIFCLDLRQWFLSSNIQSMHPPSCSFIEPTFLLYEINNSISVFSGIPQQHPPINCFLGWQSTEDKFKVRYFGFKDIDISSSNIVLPKSQPENFFKTNFTRNFPPTISFYYILTSQEWDNIQV